MLKTFTPEFTPQAGPQFLTTFTGDIVKILHRSPVTILYNPYIKYFNVEHNDGSWTTWPGAIVSIQQYGKREVGSINVPLSIRGPTAQEEQHYRYW